MTNIPLKDATNELIAIASALESKHNRIKRQIASISRRYPLDDNRKSLVKRFQTILYLVTDGEEGFDWNHTREESEEIEER